jgi:hypothetical protein
MKKIVIAYVPVLHSGYQQFFVRHKKADEVYLFGQEIIKKFDYLAKEIRALDPELTRQALLSWGFLKNVFILDEQKLLFYSSNPLFLFQVPQ